MELVMHALPIKFKIRVTTSDTGAVNIEENGRRSALEFRLQLL